ncbi:hypothetical protein ACHAXT_009311 [Thalassiosira profunda]
MPRPSLLVALAAASSASAFVARRPAAPTCRSSSSAPCTFDPATNAPINARTHTQLNMAEDATKDDTAKAAPMVSGEQLESMLQEWDQPLVVDAYATWCGPCLLMAPEFEEAAQDLAGKVRFVKLDTDLEPQMAGRLGIMGLPTLLFLDKNDDDEAVEEGKAPVAVLKERIEGALRKESILDLCNYHFFDGPMPTQLS